MSTSQSAEVLDRDLALEIGEAKELLLQHVDLVRRVVHIACSRGFSHEADDCLAWVMMRLLENDYARVRRYRGSAPFSSYLRSVVLHLARDYRVSVWGKWQSSTVARRLGLAALRLERLVWRDGHSVDDAVAFVAQQQGEDPEDLYRLWEQIPPRTVRHTFVEATLIEDLRSMGDAESRVLGNRQRELEGDLKRHLKEILAKEDPEVRRLLRAHYRDGLQIAEIARREGESRRKYYSQLARSLKRIRRELLERGIEERALEDLRWQRLELSFSSVLGESVALESDSGNDSSRDPSNDSSDDPSNDPSSDDS